MAIPFWGRQPRVQLPAGVALQPPGSFIVAPGWSSGAKLCSGSSSTPYPCLVPGRFSARAQDHNASFGHKSGADPKASAGQRGHDLGVSMDVYASSDLAQKLQVVEKIEAWSLDPPLQQ